MAKLIAIIRGQYSPEYYDSVTNSITDWTEVSDADFSALVEFSYRAGYAVVERPADEPAFIKKTVAEYLADIKVNEEKARIAAEKRAQAAIERKHKKELKDRESKLKLLEQLKKELE